MKKVITIWIKADRKVNEIGYLFRNGKAVCFNRKPCKKFDEKIIECDLIIPIQKKKIWKN